MLLFKLLKTTTKGTPFIIIYRTVELLSVTNVPIVKGYARSCWRRVFKQSSSIRPEYLTFGKSVLKVKNYMGAYLLVPNWNKINSYGNVKQKYSGFFSHCLSLQCLINQIKRCYWILLLKNFSSTWFLHATIRHIIFFVTTSWRKYVQNLNKDLKYQ